MQFVYVPLCNVHFFAATADGITEMRKGDPFTGIPLGAGCHHAITSSINKVMSA